MVNDYEADDRNIFQRAGTYALQASILLPALVCYIGFVLAALCPPLALVLLLCIIPFVGIGTVAITVTGCVIAIPLILLCISFSIFKFLKWLIGAVWNYLRSEAGPNQLPTSGPGNPLSDGQTLNQHGSTVSNTVRPQASSPARLRNVSNLQVSTDGRHDSAAYKPSSLGDVSVQERQEMEAEKEERRIRDLLETVPLANDPVAWEQYFRQNPRLRRLSSAGESPISPTATTSFQAPKRDFTFSHSYNAGTSSAAAFVPGPSQSSASSGSVSRSTFAGSVSHSELLPQPLFSGRASSGSATSLESVPESRELRQFGEEDVSGDDDDLGALWD